MREFAWEKDAFISWELFRVFTKCRVLSGIHQDRTFIDLQCWYFSGFWMGHFSLVYNSKKWICNHSAESFSQVWEVVLPPTFFLFILTYRFVMLMIGSIYKIMIIHSGVFFFKKISLATSHTQMHVHLPAFLTVQRYFCTSREAYTSSFVDVLKCSISVALSQLLFMYVTKNSQPSLLA